jgi:transcription antitermination factor NusG
MPAQNIKKQLNWYALYTKPRHEFKAQLYLESVRLENYLPTMTVTRKWSDRIKKIIEPVFRSYIFVRTDDKGRSRAMQDPTIVRTVTFDGKPAVIPDWQIENLQIMLANSPEIYISDKVEIGTKVKITSGPFTDVIGTVKEKNSETFLSVSIDLLHRSVIVRLPKESIVKLIED